DGTGIAFAKMFYPSMLPPGVKPIDFGFWDVPAHKMWRLELGDTVTAKEAEGIPFSTIGFSGSAFEGHLYTGERSGTQTSDVYETDPATNQAKIRFKMDGYFNGLYRLTQ